MNSVIVSPLTMYEIIVMVASMVNMFAAASEKPMTTATTTTSTLSANRTISATHMTPNGKTSEIALRAFYVVSAVSALVIVYFIVRWICSRRRRNKTRKYGMLKGSANGDMELHPLSEADDDDDDDDMTLFDISQRRNRNKR